MITHHLNLKKMPQGGGNNMISTSDHFGGGGLNPHKRVGDNKCPMAYIPKFALNTTHPYK